jgi:hypothetical protein
MGKYTPQQYMAFTKAHIKALLGEYSVRACDDLHDLLEEWSLQEFDAVNPDVWRYRSSMCYRLRDYGNQKKSSDKRPTSEDNRQKPHAAGRTQRERVRKQNAAAIQEKSLVKRAIARHKERQREQGTETRRQEELPDHSRRS